METTTAYLSEASEINNNYNLRGKSIRCYEAIISQSNGRVNIAPTGTMYILQDGEIIKKKTSAKLSNKYLGWRTCEIKTVIDQHGSWYSTAYATPELAILAKLNNINRDRISHYKAIEKAKETLDSYQSYSDQFYALAEDYPELLI